MVLAQDAQGEPDYSNDAYQTAAQAEAFRALSIRNAEFSGNTAGNGYVPWKRINISTEFLQTLNGLYDSIANGAAYTTNTGGESGDNVMNNADVNNRMTNLSLILRKVDGTDHGNYLEGATFQLFYCTGSGEDHTHSGHPGESGACWEAVGTPVTTESDGLLEFENLPLGDYALVETKAPAGYWLPAGYWTFTVNGDGTITDPKGVMQPAAIVQAAGDGEASYLITNNPPLAMPLTGFGQYYSFAAGVLCILTGVLVQHRARREEW